MLVIGLLAFTAATVKAEEKPVVKPDTTINSTPIKIYRLSDGLWNYSQTQLCAAAQSAIPGLTFLARINENPSGTSVYWLRFWAKENSTGKYTNVYIHLELGSSGWLEIPTLGGGWPAPRCIGDCMSDDNVWYDLFDPYVCQNISKTVMVNCGCTGFNGGANNMDPTNCRFSQFPASSVENFYNILKEIPPVVE